MDNSRVLKFANVSTPPTVPPPPPWLGQPSFDSSLAATTATGMKFPTAVLVDAAGSLWVAEYLQLPRPSFRQRGHPCQRRPRQRRSWTGRLHLQHRHTTAGKFAEPTALASTPTAPLHRQLQQQPRHLPQESRLEGQRADADGVIGQADFTSRRQCHHRADPLPAQWRARLRCRRPSLGGRYQPPSRPAFSIGPHRRRSGADGQSPPDHHPSVLGHQRHRDRSQRHRRGAPPHRIWTYRAAVGTTVWRATVRLKRGTNRIEIVAEDGFGNVSPANQLRVRRQ